MLSATKLKVPKCRRTTSCRWNMQTPCLLPWLATGLMLYACLGVTQAYHPASPTETALPSSLTEDTGRDSPGHLSNQFADEMFIEDDGPEVMMVLDPNGVICWEEVDIDGFTNATLLQWLHQQHDALTKSDQDSVGEPLQMPAGLEDPAATLREHIEQAWRSNASYIDLPSLLVALFQMTVLEDSDCPSSHTDQEPSSLHPSKLKLTSIDSFWKSVETTAATGKPLPATANYSNSMQHSEPHLQNLRNTIIILPRITTMIRPVMKHYKRNAANHIWQDTAAWSKDLLLEMLNRFLSITGAKTIPDLAEYKVLPDKVVLQDMYQSYYDADAKHRTPPIPTAQVHLPVPAPRLEQLCYSGLNTTESEREAVVNSLLQALVQLESAVDVGSEVRNVVEGGGGSWMGQYMIKREYSEGSHHVFGIIVPDLLTQLQEDTQHQSQSPEGKEEVCKNNKEDQVQNRIARPDDFDETKSKGLDFPGNDSPCAGKHASMTNAEAAAAADYPASAEAEAEASDDGFTCPSGSSCTAQTHAAPEQTVGVVAKLIDKGQIFIRPLVPTVVAQLRPVAMLLGTGGSSISNLTDATYQVESCAMTEDHATSFNSTKLSRATSAAQGMHSKASDRLTDTRASATESKHAHDNLSIQQDALPDPSTGDVIFADILIPTEHSNTAGPDSGNYHVDVSHKADGSAQVYRNLKLQAELVSLLHATADRILKESCGEGWLLQPRIADMTRLEYRVYLLNGAQAVNSSNDNNMVVYTPCILDPDSGIRTLNVTLPHGHFCSDVMVDPSKDLSAVNRGDFSQLTPWHSPETYDRIIKAGHDGAKALVNSPLGQVMKSVENVFIRVDIVLAAHWVDNDEVLLYPMINEMDWLNSAGMLATFWKEQTAAYDDRDADRNDMNEVYFDMLKKSPGYKIAKALYAEVRRVWGNGS